MIKKILLIVSVLLTILIFTLAYGQIKPYGPPGECQCLCYVICYNPFTYQWETEASCSWWDPDPDNLDCYYQYDVVFLDYYIRCGTWDPRVYVEYEGWCYEPYADCEITCP